MKYFDLATAMAVTALFASIISLFYTRRAVRHLERQVEQEAHLLEASTYYSASELVLQFDRIFIEFPDLRPYFYGDRQVPSNNPRLKNQVEATVEFVLDVLECVWDQRDKFPEEVLESWQEWIHELFERSPAMQTFYSERNQWYPQLRSLIAGASCTEHTIYKKLKETH